MARTRPRTKGAAERTTVLDRVLSGLEPASSRVREPQRSLFSDFVRAVVPQLRSSYLERHRAEDVAAQLVKLFQMVRVRTGNKIQVQLDASGEERAVLRSCMADQPFIVDTVRLLLQDVDASYVTGFNVVLPVKRDGRGRMTAVGDWDGQLESMVQVETFGLDTSAFQAAEARLLEHLHLSQAMVADFQEMTGAVEGIAERLEQAAVRLPDRADSCREAAEFLGWLLGDNFVFMGVAIGGSRLGFERLGDTKRRAAKKGEWEKAGWGNLPVQVRKSASESPVHRSGRIDEIRIQVPGEGGKVQETALLRGMFTYRAVTQASRHVPGLRRRLVQILDRDEALPGSWRYKGLANAFDSLPTEFLFTASEEETAALMDRILDAESEQEVRVHLVQGSDGAPAFVLAAMPRGQYTDALSQGMQAHLMEVTGATYCDHGVFVGRYETVLVHFFLTGAQGLEESEQVALREALSDMATPWVDSVRAALATDRGDSEVDELLERFSGAFDGEYTRRARVPQVVRDLNMLEALSEGQAVLADLFQDEKDRLNLRIYQLGRVLLSDIFPLLDNFGLVVIDQFSDAVQPRGGPDLTIDTFRLQGAQGVDPGQILERCEHLVEGLEAVFAGDMENDGFNRLLLAANLPWEDVDLIRAFCGYSRQIGLRYKTSLVQDILLANPNMSGRLVRLFHARFDPGGNGKRRKQGDAAAEVVRDGLRRVMVHDEDVVLRTLFELICATVRTNFFRRDRAAHYISLKLDHDLISSLPAPKLKYEVYVHHAEMEGVHLRGGLVARGGIRWSDREDYRTEVLGLVNTQMVKNVLNVPVGSKGGFFLKRPPEDPAKRRRRADALYEVLIRGLLEVTDNIVKGQVVSPERVVPHDGEDPYLVVAADKGTAHLSDTANRLSHEYGFWLDDAFASGGSVGYDHKKEGITARGAWECVRRHLLESGLDPRTDSFTCMGVGDPAGDVFGNGVVEHENMRLVGAFNHLHVFLDPDPRQNKQHAELVRLFEEGAGWDKFNKKVLSKGGGIFDRRSKSIPLSPEVQQMLGTLKEELPPDTVIRLLLRLPVDLFWNGGIGTYVKASWETHRDADDAANDNLRVNADELRARAVGEGGNLGFTQSARVEFAMKGGAINTDAIDNSGGVDMSDHEVNLKILLAREVGAQRLKGNARDALIRKFTDEIAVQVLANNDLHARQISLDRVRSTRDPFPLGRAIEWIAEEGGPTATDLALPTADDLIRRAELRQGLTRPELAVVSAWVKMHLQRHLEGAEEEDIPGLNGMLLEYFPKGIRKSYPEGIEQHMLARPIGLTVALTRLVADTGAGFVPALLDLTDRPVPEIFGGWFRAVDGLGLDGIRGQVAGANAPLEARYLAWVRVVEAVAALMASAMAPGEPGLTPEHLKETKAVLGRMGRHRGRTGRARLKELSSGLGVTGFGEALSDKVAALSDLTVASEIAGLRRASKDSLRDAIVRYLAIGKASGLLPAIRLLETRRGSGPWDEVARGILRTRYFLLLRELVSRTPVERELKLGVDRASFRLGRGVLKDVGQMVDHVLGDAPDVGALLVAEERLRAAILRGG